MALVSSVSTFDARFSATTTFSANCDSRTSILWTAAVSKDSRWMNLSLSSFNSLLDCVSAPLFVAGLEFVAPDAVEFVDVVGAGEFIALTERDAGIIVERRLFLHFSQDHERDLFFVNLLKSSAERLAH